MAGVAVNVLPSVNPDVRLSRCRLHFGFPPLDTLTKKPFWGCKGCSYVICWIGLSNAFKTQLDYQIKPLAIYSKTNKSLWLSFIGCLVAIFRFFVMRFCSQFLSSRIWHSTSARFYSLAFLLTRNLLYFFICELTLLSIRFHVCHCQSHLSVFVYCSTIWMGNYSEFPLGTNFVQYQERQREEEGVRDDMPGQGQHRLLARKLVSEIGIGYLCLCFFLFFSAYWDSEWLGRGKGQTCNPFCFGNYFTSHFCRMTNQFNLPIKFSFL